MPGEGALAVAPSARAVVAIARVPVELAGCFGWLHHPGAGIRRATAVLLCGGVSQDASTGHRPLRQLADRLAEAGYGVLRFDYPGTGDSCDLANGAEHWAAWRAGVDAAADWLRANTGAARVLLVGLRLGAAMAALTAAQRDDVAGLVLLAPVLRGKTYVAQLAVEARLRDPAAAADGGLTLAELSLGAETVRQMRAVSLAELPPSARCPVVVHAQGPSAALDSCVQAWERRGVAVTRAGFDGLDALLRPTHHADEPDADFSAVTGWIAAAAPAPMVARVPRVAEAALRPPGCIETARRFGSHGHLAGILCRPSGHDLGLAVVIANSGGNPHHGFARFSVEFARSLARVGIASLRLDFAGLGDSPHPDGEGPTEIFAIDRTGDMRCAVDELERLGYRQFAAHGLCSGAYHALHAAMADDRIQCVLLVNLPWFTLRHERAGPDSFARRCAVAFQKRDARALFLYADGDSGLAAFHRHLDNAAALPASIALSVVPGWDHELTGDAMRREATRAMQEFLFSTTSFGQRHIDHPSSG